MPSRGTVVAVGGGLAVAVILVSLAVVEANTGPFPHDVGSATLGADLTGSFLAEQGGGPGCQDDLSGTCDPPRTEIVVRLEQLPALEPDARYVARLVAPDDEVDLGSLEPASGGHELAWAGELDGDRFDQLVVEARAGDQDEGVPVLSLELPTSDGERVPLRGSFGSLPAEPAGRVDLAQIGAVEVAVTAQGTVTGIPRVPGWTPSAWLVDGSGASTSLGALAWSGEEAATVDARAARVVLADQERFLVTLEPGAGPGDDIAGLPIGEAAVEARTLGSVLG